MENDNTKSTITELFKNAIIMFENSKLEQDKLKKVQALNSTAISLSFVEDYIENMRLDMKLDSTDAFKNFSYE